jgi:hypothetical protein
MVSTFERVGELREVALRKIGFLLDPYTIRLNLPFVAEGGPEEVIPDREEPSEIHAGIRGGFPVVPPVVLCHGEDEAKPTSPVGDVAVLEKQVKVEDRQETRHDHGRDPEETRDEKAR